MHLCKKIDIIMALFHRPVTILSNQLCIYWQKKMVCEIDKTWLKYGKEFQSPKKRKCCLKTNGDTFLAWFCFFFFQYRHKYRDETLAMFEIYSFDYCVRKHRALLRKMIFNDWRIFSENKMRSFSYNNAPPVELIRYKILHILVNLC